MKKLFLLVLLVAVVSIGGNSIACNRGNIIKEKIGHKPTYDKNWYTLKKWYA